MFCYTLDLILFPLDNIVKVICTYFEIHTGLSCFTLNYQLVNVKLGKKIGKFTLYRGTSRNFFFEKSGKMAN